MKWTLVVLTISSAAIWPSFADAQHSDADQRAAASLFHEAMFHADRGETAEALDRFRQSLARYPTTATAFNLALTLHDIGKVVEAIETIEELVDGRFGELPPERLEQASSRRRAYASEVATLVVRIDGTSTADIRIDGSRSGETSPDDPLRIRVDPGGHVVTGRARSVIREAEINVERGELTEVVLSFPPLEAREETIGAVTPSLLGANIEQVDSSTTIFEEPWFWIIAGIVAIGSGIGIALALQGNEQPTPDEPIFGSHEVLRSTP